MYEQIRASILKTAKGIYEEAFDANMCISILLQIGELKRAGNHGMESSPVFFIRRVLQ